MASVVRFVAAAVSSTIPIKTSQSISRKEKLESNLSSYQGFGGRGIERRSEKGILKNRVFPFLKTAFESGVSVHAMERTAEISTAEKDNLAAVPDLITEFMVDMKCEGCVKNVKKRLEPLPGVKSVNVDLENKVVRVLSNLVLKELEAALEKTGLRSRLIGQGDPAYLTLTASVAEFKGPEVFGVVRFSQISQELARVEAKFDGLAPGIHAWSVNQFGDLTNGANSTGGCYEPDAIVKASASTDKEVKLAGDLGQLSADKLGHAEFIGTSSKLKVWDLIGRSVVVYEGGELSGNRTAAAVIARSAGIGENYKSICSCDGTIIWEATNSDFVKPS